MKFHFGQCGVRKQVVQHVRLLVIVRCQKYIVYNVFQCLMSHKMRQKLLVRHQPGRT